MIGRMGLHFIIGVVILALVGVTGFPAVNPLIAVNMCALLAVIELIRSGGIILGAVGFVIGAGVPIGVKLAAIRSGGSLVSLIAFLHGVAMTRLGKHYTAVIGNLRSGGSILEELAAGAPVVLLVAVSGAGSILFVHLGKMVGMHMARCRLHHKSALRAGLRCGFRCGRACRVSHYGIMVRRIASADMGVAVGLLVAPLGSVEIVGGGVECSVRDPVNGITVRVKQLAALFALLISVPAFFFTSGSLCGDRSLACVCARCIFYRYSTGGGLVACLCRNGCRAGGYRSYLTGVVNRCNGLLA